MFGGIREISLHGCYLQTVGGNYNTGGNGGNGGNGNLGWGWGTTESGSEVTVNQIAVIFLKSGLI